MSRKLEECTHCKGKKNCARSGGRSCSACLRAAGRGARDWGSVRCTYCGGLGRVWVETPEAPEAPAE